MAEQTKKEMFAVGSSVQKQDSDDDIVPKTYKNKNKGFAKYNFSICSLSVTMYLCTVYLHCMCIVKERKVCVQEGGMGL